MALTLALQNSVGDYTQITLTDTTGDYSSTNVGGWGVPNIELSSVVYAHLIVTLPSGAVVDIDIINDLEIDFSTVTSDELVYNLTYEMLYSQSSEATLPDGIYAIQYAIADQVALDEDANYILNTNIMTYYTVQAGVFERIGEIPTYYKCASCDNQYVKETTTLFMLLQSLIAASTYSSTVQFTSILTVIEDILSFDSTNTENCGC